MISVSGFAVRFGGKTLFEDVSFLINRTDRIGLAGRNGAGKSTLLKILAGINKATEGSMSIPRDCKVSYLPQDIDIQSNLNVLEETRTAFKEVVEIEKKLEETRHALNTREDYESDGYMKLIEDLTTLEEKFNLLGGYFLEEEMEKILRGLGFQREDFTKSVAEFSGGWQMRIELAKILLQKPDLILLDEPTNHLDIESIGWLENFLTNYDGALILVSHDKIFLDTVTNRTIEITRGGIEDYKANYTKYLTLREERKEQLLSAQKNQQDQIKQIERNIERFRAKASKAAFAQSLAKKLDKIDVIEVEDDDVSAMNIRFQPAQPSGRLVLKAENISKSYGPKRVLNNVNLEILRGERIAFVGKNGMGKTTLSKVIAKEVEYDGNIEIGYNVKLGYFAQHQAAELNNDQTVFDVIDTAAYGDMRTQVRSMLGAFLFSGESVEKKVKVLSGGERGRLAMCKLLLEPYNVLLLDEPTNHLDLKSKEVLKQALLKFDGTIIIVSHDRDFLDGLVTKVFEFTPDGVTEFLGGIQYFLEKKKAVNFREFEKEKMPVVEVKKQEEKATVSVEKKDTKKLQNQLQQIEKKIDDLQKKIKIQEDKLQDPESFQKLSNDANFFAQYEKLKAELVIENEKWEQLFLEIEN